MGRPWAKLYKKRSVFLLNWLFTSIIHPVLKLRQLLLLLIDWPEYKETGEMITNSSTNQSHSNPAEVRHTYLILGKDRAFTH